MDKLIRLFTYGGLRSVDYINNVYRFYYNSIEINSYSILIGGIISEYNRKFKISERQIQDIEEGKLSGKEIARLIREYHAHN